MPTAVLSERLGRVADTATAKLCFLGALHGLRAPPGSMHAGWCIHTITSVCALMYPSPPGQARPSERAGPKSLRTMLHSMAYHAGTEWATDSGAFVASPSPSPDVWRSKTTLASHGLAVSYYMAGI